MMSTVADLQDLCLNNIAKNVIFHSEVFHEAKNEELHILYSRFQLLFSDELLEKIRDIHCDVHRNTEDPETSRFSDYLFSRIKWKGNSLQRCLNFVFNKFTKNVFVSCQFCTQKRKAPWKVTSHVLSKCEDPRVVDLALSNLKQSDFLRALPKWHKVLKLDLTATNCTNKMVFKIWESLPDLRELCLHSCARISDKCLYYLCKNICWESTKTPVCKENGSCTSMGKKLRCFNVSFTKLTDCGIACALLHLQLLNTLENDVNIETQACAVANGVIKANEICIQNTQIPLRLHLSQITCTKLLTPEKLREVLPVCPSLRCLSLFASTKHLTVLAKNPRDTIESVFMYFTSASILDSLPFQNFLLKVGGQLHGLALNVKSGTLRTGHFVEILKACPNLIRFFVGASSYIGESDYDDVYNIPESVEKLSELCLFAKVADREPLVTFFVQVIKQAKDLKELHMSCCFMNYIGSRLDQKFLQNLHVNW